MSDVHLEARVQQLEDRVAISDLVARYGFTVDDRDIKALAKLFAGNGRFRSQDGVLDAQGRDAIMDQFHGRFAVLGPTNHVTHDHLIWFDADDPDRAFGRLNSHAEVVRHGRTLVTALRYADEYVRSIDGWQFADRLLSFLYYVPAVDYAEALESNTRMRVYDEPTPGDWPEGLKSWQAYYGETSGD